MPVFLTAWIDPRLFGYIDFWSTTQEPGPFSGYHVLSAGERRALGERVGIYNSFRPAYGAGELIDAPAIENRVNPWIAWKYSVDQYFLWEVAYWIPAGINPWETMAIGGTTHHTWGAGSIIYSGEDREFREDSREIPGPIASIRMKSWRRGQQDYEYLWLAHHMGIAVDAIVNSVVPGAFDDYNGATYTTQRQQPPWPQRGYAFEKARKDIAFLISEEVNRKKQNKTSR